MRCYERQVCKLLLGIAALTAAALVYMCTHDSHVDQWESACSLMQGNIQPVSDQEWLCVVLGTPEPYLP
jgi:hypothetical protein